MIQQILPAQPGWFVWESEMSDPLPVVCWALIECEPAVTGCTQCVVPMVQRIGPSLDVVALSPQDSLSLRLVGPDAAYEYDLAGNVAKASDEGWTPINVSQSSDSSGTADYTVLVRRPLDNPYYKPATDEELEPEP